MLLVRFALDDYFPLCHTSNVRIENHLLMDCSIHIEELAPEKIADLVANPEGLHGLIFSNSDDWEGTDRVAMSDNNGWQTVHFLLAGDAWGGEWPLNFMAAMTVGTPVSYGEEYPPAKLFSAEEVQTISKALEEVSTSELTSRFDEDARGLSKFDCPHRAFDSTDEFLNEFVAPRYENIKRFAANAASKNQGLLVAWTMM